MMMSANFSLEVKDDDISRADFLGTMEKLIHIWPVRVLNTTPNFERRMRHCVEAALFYNPNMHGDFEWWLDDEGFKHIDIQIQRRSERHGRTLGFKDSNVNNLVTFDQTNIRRKTGDGRRSLILNEMTQQSANLMAQDKLDFAEAAKHLASCPANERAFVNSNLSQGSPPCEIRWCSSGTTLRNLKCRFRAGQH